MSRFGGIIKTIADFNQFLEGLDMDSLTDDEFDGLINSLETTQSDIQEIMDSIEESEDEGDPDHDS